MQKWTQIDMLNIQFTSLVFCVFIFLLSNIKTLVVQCYFSRKLSSASKIGLQKKCIYEYSREKCPFSSKDNLPCTEKR